MRLNDKVEGLGEFFEGPATTQTFGESDHKVIQDFIDDDVKTTTSAQEYQTALHAYAKKGARQKWQGQEGSEVPSSLPSDNGHG